MKSVQSRIIVLAILLSVGLIITYSNHFSNGFHFDDSHTIESNPFITSLHNIPLFFKEGKTFSTMPSHWGFRPMVTTTLAIDYWIGGGLKPFYFHLSTFLWYMVLCVLLYFIFKNIINKSIDHKWAGYFALLAASLYAFHTANAETINYIISRSDVLSTLCIVASMSIFISYPKLRKWGFYILPAIICVGFKETVVVLPIILFFYVILFEKELSILDLFKRENFKIFYKTLFLIVPLIIAICVFQLYSLSKVPSDGLSNFSNPFIPYILTQTFVWVHYFFTFLIPMNLSADTDWTVLTNPFDDRVFVGITFILLLITVIFKTSQKPKYRPISFGLIWFSIALIPTSIIPLTEVMNDHRIFFPFIGLAFSVVYALSLVVIKFENDILKDKKYQALVWVVIALVLSGYAYGAHQRNKVWKDEASLWLDVTVKSPQNGRGLMNYGLTQMAIGNYDKASECFEKALIYTPYYSYLHINLGILKSATGKPVEAEVYFKKAIQYGQNYNEPYYYYANFLKLQNRISEAKPMVEKSLQINPDYMLGLYLAMDIYLELELWDNLDVVAKRALNIAPKDSIALKYSIAGKKKETKLNSDLLYAEKNPTPENFLNLSLIYYNKGLYEKCIDACNRALILKPNYPEAYNNICSSYNAMKKWDLAIEACSKSIIIKPDFELAKNNLRWAQQQKQSGAK